MNILFYTVAIIFVSLGLSLNTFRVFPIDETGLFITVIGLLYGLIAAFVITNSWERFSKIRDAVTGETASLLNTYQLLGKMKDKKILIKFSRLVTLYCAEVLKVNWDDKNHKELSYRWFSEFFDTINESTVRTNRDDKLFSMCLQEIHEARTYKDHQIVLAETKLSNIQWTLLIFLSTILTFSIIFLSLPLTIISWFISSAMVMSVLLILLVIYELNSMKMAEKEVSMDPYIHIQNVLKKELQ